MVLVQLLLPRWIALFPMLESVTFTKECAGQFGTSIQEIFVHELAAKMPTLRAITFGSDVRQIRHDGVALASAELVDAK